MSPSPPSQVHSIDCNATVLYVIFFLWPRASSSHAPPSRNATRSTGLASDGAARPTGSFSAKTIAAKPLQSSTQLTDNSSGVHRVRHSTGGEGELEIRLDLDEAVQRLEKEMDDVTITSPGGTAGTRGVVAVGGVASSMRVESFHDDDILPGAAEHMGSGD